MEDNFQNQNNNQNGGGYAQYTRPYFKKRNWTLYFIHANYLRDLRHLLDDCINDDVNEVVGDRTATSGGMVFLFSLLTCGIYGIYWVYCMGEKLDRYNGKDGNSGLLFVLLTIFWPFNCCILHHAGASESACNSCIMNRIAVFCII